MALMRALTLLALSLTSACRDDGAKAPAGNVRASAPAPSASERRSSPPGDATVSDGLLAPLSGTEPLVALPVAGFGDAVVSLPLGSRTSVSSYVALHGNFDRPEWQCDVWRGVVGNEAFVLCPRGIARSDVAKNLDRWTYAAFAKTEAEVLAAVAALERAYPGRVDRARMALMGFSLGAAHVARLLERHGDRFPRAVLIEGGERGFTVNMARKFVTAGGEAVLFACAQSVCTSRAKGAAKVLERSGARVRVFSAGNLGHTYDGAVAQGVGENLAWLWASSPPQPEPQR
jgi:predicted esterase